MNATATPTLPANVSRTFARIPQAQTVLVEMGHGYGKAKFASRCPMTGLSINVGTMVRKVDCYTRSGKHLDAYVAAKSAEFWGFHGGSEGLTGETGDMAHSGWRRFTNAAEFLADIGDLDGYAVGTEVTVAETMDYAIVTKTWIRTEAGWSSSRKSFSGSEPVNASSNKTTTKQLAAGFARRTRGTAYRIDLPYSR